MQVLSAGHMQNASINMHHAQCMDYRAPCAMQGLLEKWFPLQGERGRSS